MPRRLHPRTVSFAEILGLAVGGSALLVVLTAQVMFVAWML
jgi:hypothetical protein